MQLTNAILVVSAALGVSAHPSLHHQHHHKRSPLTFLKATKPASDNLDSPAQAASVPETPAEAPVEAPPTTTTIVVHPVAAPQEVEEEPQPEPTPTSAPVEEEEPSDDSSDEPTAAVKPFPCAGGSKKRATYSQIMYTGNTGSCGWGKNMMEIDNSIVGSYDYTISFSAPTEDMTCQCFNKMGPDGGLNGAFQNSAVKLQIPAGGKKSIAAEADTQAVCACGFGDEVPVCSNIGQWIGTWAEFDMGSSPNGGQSGADVSVLAAQDCPEQNTFPGMRIKANEDVCSWLTTDGTMEFQAYINGNHDADGVGCTGYTTNHLDIILGNDFPEASS